jgi:CBS domain-containing protein
MPVGELATKKVITAPQDITIQDAAQIMSQKRISCLILVDKAGSPIGIVTDRDLRDKVVAAGRDCGECITNIMSPPNIRSDVKEYCFEAILKMVKHNVHHLLVMKNGILKGVLTNHDLMLIQGTSPISVVKDIETQKTVEGLIPVSKKINNIVGLLLTEGAKASNITRIITEINDRLVKKILEIAEEQLGEPPLPYCWAVFGSEGRKEQTFKTDQDNALIYVDPPDADMEKEATEYFSKFTLFVREGLYKCGFPPCPADFMATNPMWRQPLHVWRRYFTKWITTPTSEAILNSVTFFDFRAVHGETRLMDWLKESTLNMAKDSKVFLGFIGNMAIKNMPPIGFLKTFVVEKSGEHKDKLNMKIKGIAPLIDIMRLFALEKGVFETSTLDRIRVLKDQHTIVKEFGDELQHAFEFIMMLRIRHQFEQVKADANVDNFINPNNLSNLEKRIAKETFQLISKIQDMIIERYKAMIF